MIKLFLPLFAAALAAAGAFQSAGAQVAPGALIGSETVVFSAGDTLGNHTSFEAILSSNSSFMVTTVLVEVSNSDGSPPFVDIGEWKIYDSSGGPFTLEDADGPLAAQGGQVKSIAGADVLPLGVPQGGSLRIAFEALGMSSGDHVRVTFVYAANAGSATTAKIAPTSQQLPLAIENFGVQTSGPALTVDNTFVDPEMHCELCTIVRYVPDGATNASAAYIADGIDLSGAQELVFWSRGDAGNQTATFMAAGKEEGNETLWANTTSITIGQDWQRHTMGLAGVNLANVTRLFGFEVSGERPQTFYLKGMAYN